MCLRLLSYYNENFGPDRSDRSVSVQPNQSIGPIRSVQALNSINRSRSGLNLRDNRSGPRPRLSIPGSPWFDSIKALSQVELSQKNAAKEVSHGVKRSFVEFDNNG